MDVDEVEIITKLSFDYVLIATVDSYVAESIINRLTGYGIDRNKLLTITVPDNKEQLLSRFLDVDTVKAYEHKKKGVQSHA